MGKIYVVPHPKKKRVQGIKTAFPRFIIEEPDAFLIGYQVQGNARPGNLAHITIHYYVISHLLIF